MAAVPGLATEQAPAVILALRSGVYTVNVTNAADVHVDLQTQFGATYIQKFLSIICDQPMFYNCSDGAADATNTGAGGNCDLIPANARLEGFPPGRYLHLRAASATAGIVRMHLSSP